MGKPRKKVATGQNSKSGGGARGGRGERGERGHKAQSNREELWEQMERTNLQSDEADSEEEEEEGELRAPFPVGMWDLLQCDPKGELMINSPPSRMSVTFFKVA